MDFLNFLKSKLWSREFVSYMWGLVTVILWEVVEDQWIEYCLAFTALLTYFIVLPWIREHCE